MTLLHQGVSLQNPLLSQFKTSIRAAADIRGVDVEVEEALLVGVRKEKNMNEVGSMIKRVMEKMIKAKSLSRLLLKAAIALNALSFPRVSYTLNRALFALIKTEKVVAEMKRFTKSSFEKYENNIKPFYIYSKERFQ